MGIAGLVVTSKYNTKRHFSHSYNNINNYQTWVVLTILHPKLIILLLQNLKRHRHPAMGLGNDKMRETRIDKLLDKATDII